MRLSAYLILVLSGFAAAADEPAPADEAARFAAMVRLTAAEEEHLQLAVEEAEEGTFEDTVFALGSLEVLPGKRAVVSSRIPGRAFSVLVLPHQRIAAGDEVAWIESRQPGDPPPTVMLPAPIDGLVSRVDLAVGQPVSPDDALVEIVNLDVLEASAHVPQPVAAAMQPGLTARIRLLALPDRTFEAKLAHIAVEADEAGDSLEAAFHVPNPDGLLRPGMRAEFSIITGRREGVLTIPRAALIGDPGNRFVFIRDYELPHAFVRTPVRTGVQNDTLVEITAGLLPGDEVVTRGGWQLASAGSSVSLKEAMDAAHGHPHNEDGTEMTKEQIAAAAAGAHGGDHDHAPADPMAWNLLAVFFAAVSGFLLVMLALVLFLLRKPAAPARHA